MRIELAAAVGEDGKASVKKKMKTDFKTSFTKEIEKKTNTIFETQFIVNSE